MTHTLRLTIKAIHAAPPRLVYLFSGAGSQALTWLHAVAGSSRSVLEASDAYAPRALALLLGASPAQAVSAATAEAMAARAFARAAILAEADWPLLGVACTAAIATDRTRRGADQAFVAVCGAAGTHTYALTLRAAGSSAGRRRSGQEQLVSQLVIAAISAACNLPTLSLVLRPGESLSGPVASATTA